MRWTAADIANLTVARDTSRRSERRSAGRKAAGAKQDVSTGIVAPAGSQGPAAGGEYIYLAVTPCPKPRMTRRDKWRTRPCVLRYRQFCDAVREAWPAGTPYPEAGAHVTFYLPMPRSWSKRKRDAMRGQPHRQKPDADNMLKALLDALHTDDCAVWDVRITKRWADTGYITITTTAGPIAGER